MSYDVVRRILSHYSSEPTGVRVNLARILNHGVLGGTGKMLIQAVDQGFEHGPARSFLERGKLSEDNPNLFWDNSCTLDPEYHFEMAKISGLSAYAAPMGWLSGAVDKYVDSLPTILKINSSNGLYQKSNEPSQALTSTVTDALRLGCVAVGYTLYPGSDENLMLMEEAKNIIAEARSYGLPTILWSYARGGDLSKEGESALDVIAYGAHMACLLGAHIVKVKVPSNHIALKEHKSIYEKIKKDTVKDRIKHVVDCCFKGKRMVIFSGGEQKDDAGLLAEITGIHEGGGFGSIIGRNIFKREKNNAIKIVHDIHTIYKKETL